MASLVAGIDWSTRGIHAALVPIESDHKDPTLPEVTMRYAMLDSRLQGCDRIRTVRNAVQQVLRDVIAYEDRSFNVYAWDAHRRHDVSSVWVEEAYGAHRNVDRIMLPIFGAIVAAVPDRMAVASLSALEWRKQMSLPMRGKEGPVAAANEYLAEHNLDPVKDDHEAEALCIALCGRELIWKHWADGRIVG